MTAKQLGGLQAPDGSQYVTLTDGSGNLVSDTGLSSLTYGIYSTTTVSPGTGYVPGDALTVVGGTTSLVAGYLSSTILIVTDTQVITATVNNGGSGGANGPVTITGTTGTGTKFQATGTITGGVLQPGLVITVAGDYTINPTLTGEPVTGGSLVGATVNLTMGVFYTGIQNQGNYSISPTNPVSVTGGTGTGATFTLAIGVNSALVLPLGNQAQPISAANENVRYGFKALNSVTTGVENTAIGWQALASTTTGNNNTGVGTGAGIFLAGGSNNNVSIGVDSLRNMTGGSQNVSVGASALKSNTFATNFSTAIGANALLNWNSNTPTTNNTAIGNGAALGATNASFANVTAIGNNAGSVLLSGSNNTIIGSGVASTTLTTGARNILIGTASNTDTAASGTNDSIVIGASTGSTPWLTGSLTAAAPSAVFSGTVKTLVTVVASLPSAATAGAGATAFVTDASNSFIVGLGLTVVGGGANKVPVYSDGTNWIIG